MPLPVTYNFNTTENPLSTSYWQTLSGFSNLRASSGLCYSAGAYGAALWIADSFPDDQYAQFKVTTLPSGMGADLLLRFQQRHRQWVLHLHIHDSMDVRQGHGRFATDIGAAQSSNLHAGHGGSIQNHGYDLIRLLGWRFNLGPVHLQRFILRFGPTGDLSRWYDPTGR